MADDRTVREIMLATDFSDTSDAALDVAETYARLLGARIHLFHVVWAGEVEVTPLLASIAERLRAAALVTIVVERGDPARKIVEYARAHPIDLIVVGTHGRTGVSRALIGSVAERVVRTAPCPVLTVPHAAQQARAPEPVAPPTLRGCLVCARPSDDLICETCRAHIRGEAVERKQREERAGRA